MKSKVKFEIYGAILFVIAWSTAFAAEPPKNVVPMDQAQTTALKKYAGTVKSGELEKEEGKWVYSFDIAGTDKKLHEVWVDARNGKIVKHKIESAREEEKEQKTERGD